MIRCRRMRTKLELLKHKHTTINAIDLRLPHSAAVSIHKLQPFNHPTASALAELKQRTQPITIFGPENEFANTNNVSTCRYLEEACRKSPRLRLLFLRCSG